MRVYRVLPLSDITRRRSAKVLWWRYALNALLVCVDALCYAAVMILVLYFRNEQIGPYSTRFEFRINWLLYACVCSIIWVLCAHACGVYHRHVVGDASYLVTMLLKASLICTICVFAFNYIFGFDYSIYSIIYAQLFTFLALLLERQIIRIILTANRKKRRFSYPTVIVGSPRGILEALRFMAQRSQLSYLPVAVYPIAEGEEGRCCPAYVADSAAFENKIKSICGYSLPIIGETEDIAEVIVKLGGQTVMITDLPQRFSDEFNAFVIELETASLEVVLMTSPGDVSGHSIRMRSIQGTSLMTVTLPQYTPVMKFGKRVFDIVVSTGAIIISSIVTIPVAVAIKMTDGGPVFYRQTRIGVNGKPFQMVKFRSMIVDADKYKKDLAEKTGQEGRFIFKMKDDPRVTRVGKIIRKYSIDEIPQFLNVLKGDMSVVGPRPPLPEEYERYTPLYATRMLVKPGITGPWQISGRSDLSEEESEALDVTYVQEWSIFGDFLIMLRTVGAVIRHKGAY